MTLLEEDLVRLYRERRVDLSHAGLNPASQAVADLLGQEWDLILTLLKHHGLDPDREIPGETERAKSRATMPKEP